MKKTRLNLLVACWGVLILQTIIFAEEVAWENVGGAYQNIQAVLVDYQNPQNFYFGSNQGVFGSTDGGKNWNNVLSLKGGNKGVNALAANDKYSIYAATRSGLFFSFDCAKTWSKIFQGKSALEKDCRALAINKDCIYLGTKAGLFVSFDRGKNWKRQPGVLGYSDVLAITFDKKAGSVVYAACVEGLFKTQNNSQSWDKIFAVSATENDSAENEESKFQDKEEKFSIIRYVAINSENNNQVYLSTSSGVFQSDNSGQTWQRLTTQGLLEKEVRTIVISSNSQLYCATKTGIFLFRENNWQNLSIRLIPGEINGFSLDNFADLYVASNKGFFKSRHVKFIDEKDDKNNLKPDFLNDAPSIAEIQFAAVKYAEVEPEKIIKWRNQAAKKAFLPQVSIGLDRNTTDLRHWEGGSTTKPDDDILRRGRDSIDWNISLSWDLSELIWNNDQTSIDARSRLIVQLRNDILDEVTKLYFERIRLKSEFENLDILDKKKKQEKELRIKELNAYLDGLTGGYFSAHLAS